LASVLEVGFVPKGRYKYHEDRYKRAGKPFCLKQSWGFRLPNSKNYNLPDTVVRALIGIYSRFETQEITPVKKVGRPTRRVPRNRTRSDSLSRALSAVQDCIKDDVANIVKRPGLLARATAELTFRMRDDPSYIPDEEIYDVLVEANEYVRTKEFERALARDGGFFRGVEIDAEMRGIISLRKARKELARARRRPRTLRAPDGSTIEWF
jgi:hypothetical protein